MYIININDAWKDKRTSLAKDPIFILISPLKMRI